MCDVGFSESPVVERQQEHLQEQKYPQLYHHCSYSVGGNGTDVDGFIGGRRTGTGPTAESIDDRFALSLLFRSCHGQRWLRRSGWSAGTDDMVGVAWTSDMSRVIKLELGTNRVEGEGWGVRNSIDHLFYFGKMPILLGFG